MSEWYRPESTPAAITLIAAALPADESARLAEAFQFAAAAHAGQVRDEGTPYIEHPVRVVSILWDEIGKREDPDLLIAALNHDVLEDCEWLPREVLVAAFGERVTRIVEDVTKERVPEPQKAQRDRAYMDRLPGLPLHSRLLKLADRIDNLRSVRHSPDDEKAGRYLQVSRAEFIPLALATDQTAARLVIEACDELERDLRSRGIG
ncbi:MAG: HD domain-containing protein [Chloroflexota bacterium]